MEKITKNCLDLVKEFEGCYLKAYRDEVGVWTIGYGITNSDKAITKTTIKAGLTISKATAESWLEKSLTQKYLPLVMKYNDHYKWNQNEIDALVSFAYNIGSIKGLTANGTRSRSTIAKKMLEYNKAGGRVYRGLTRRRTAEKKLFTTPIKVIKVEEAKPSTAVQKDYTKERIDGVKYFGILKNTAVKSFTEFLHNRGFGAGKPNLSKIASANAGSAEVKEALLTLARKGLLVKPDGLNKWEEKK